MTARLPPLAAAVLLVLVAWAPLPARAADGGGDRWDAFSRLLIARWRDRATGALNERDTSDLWKRCLDDAWFLPLAAIVEDPETSACGQLLRPRGVRPARASVVAEWRRRMSRKDHPAEFADWRACTALARKHQDAVLLSACGTALRGRSDRLASMPDKERFDRWLVACKHAMGVEPPAAAPPPEKPAVAVAASPDAGTPAPSPPAAPPVEKLAPIPASDLDHARHCHRLLPTFYEVNGFKKSSEYWTPAELKVLTRRMKQLAGD